MANKKNIPLQEKVARTILEQTRSIMLGGKTYTIAPPSIGTLILASSMLSKLPKEMKVEKGREFQDIISQAKDYAIVAEIASVLILGAKKANEEVEVTVGKGGLFRRAKKKLVTRREALAKTIMEDTAPSELRDAIVPLFEGLQLNDFFVTTTFLTGMKANVTEPTKVEKATASGRS